MSKVNPTELKSETRAHACWWCQTVRVCVYRKQNVKWTIFILRETFLVYCTKCISSPALKPGFWLITVTQQFGQVMSISWSGEENTPLPIKYTNTQHLILHMASTAQQWKKKCNKWAYSSTKKLSKAQRPHPQTRNIQFPVQFSSAVR